MRLRREITEPRLSRRIRAWLAEQRRADEVREARRLELAYRIGSRAPQPEPDLTLEKSWMD